MDLNKVNEAYWTYTLRFYDLCFNYQKSLFEAGTKAIKSSDNSENFQNQFRQVFDEEFRKLLKEQIFCDSLSNFMRSYIALAPLLNHEKMYRHMETMSNISDSYVEQIRDVVNRTPSEVIPMKGKFELHHYKPQSPKKYQTPILMVGSLINRHYILDLMPDTSIVRFFQKRGFDVYATDWRMPTVNDEEMTLSTYAHDYLENAVDKVEEITGSRKVILFGYCWGGILSLMYSTLHPQDVQCLILHATPIDFSKKPTVLESWIKNFDVEKFVQIFGNVPSSFLNLVFLIRNPLEALLKYYFYFSRPRTIKEIKQFLAVESWLYDSVPIIGKAFEQIISDIYKKNLLIKNKMMLGKKPIDLKNITMPILNIVGTNDDLVSAESSRTITQVIPSSEKKTLEFPTGHVGLCISRSAHKKLWPEVGQWLIKHSN